MSVYKMEGGQKVLLLFGIAKPYHFFYGSVMVSLELVLANICNGWNGQLPLARLRFVVPV